MKKLIITGLLTITAFVFCTAQASSGLYLFTKEQDGQAVVRELNLALKLPDEQLAKVRNLIISSVKNELEVLKNPENKKPDMIKAVEARQTASIEAELKTILGLDRFNIYLQKKEDITKKVKQSEKAP